MSNVERDARSANTCRYHLIDGATAPSRHACPHDVAGNPSPQRGKREPANTRAACSKTTANYLKPKCYRRVRSHYPTSPSSRALPSKVTSGNPLANYMNPLSSEHPNWRRNFSRALGEFSLPSMALFAQTPSFRRTKNLSQPPPRGHGKGGRSKF